MYAFFCYAVDKVDSQDININKKDNVDNLVNKENRNINIYVLILLNLLFGISGSLGGFGLSWWFNRWADNKYQIYFFSPLPKYFCISLFAIILGLIYNYKRVFKDYLFLLCYVFVLTFLFNPMLGFYPLFVEQNSGSVYLFPRDGDNITTPQKIYLGFMIVSSIITSICFAKYSDLLYKYKTYFMFAALILFILHLILVAIDLCWYLAGNNKIFK